MLLARQLYFEAVKVGDELPPLVKPPVDRTQVARYAGASGDYGPLHVDETFARNAGFPSVLVPGLLAMGFLGELVTDWLRGARVRRLSARFVKIVWPGDLVTARGRVADRRFEPGGKYAIDIEVWGENQRGELVVRGAATAQLYYGAEDESRQRAGQPALVVTAAEEEERLARLSRGSAPARPAVGTRPAAPMKPMPVVVRPAPAAVPVRPAVEAPAPRPAPPRPATPVKPIVAPRPVAKPAPKPAPRPPPKPAPKPAAPAVKKPAPKPAPRPPAKPAPRPTKKPVAKAAPKPAKSGSGKSAPKRR